MDSDKIKPSDFFQVVMNDFLENMEDEFKEDSLDPKLLQELRKEWVETINNFGKRPVYYKENSASQFINVNEEITQIFVRNEETSKKKTSNLNPDVIRDDMHLQIEGNNKVEEDDDDDEDDFVNATNITDEPPQQRIKTGIDSEIPIIKQEVIDEEKKNVNDVNVNVVNDGLEMRINEYEDIDVGGSSLDGLEGAGNIYQQKMDFIGLDDEFFDEFRILPKNEADNSSVVRIDKEPQIVENKEIITIKEEENDDSKEESTKKKKKKKVKK